MPSHMLMEFDKAGAEWVVVAYICGDENMLNVIRSGESPHVATGHLITGAPKELIVLEDKIIDKLTDPDEILRLRTTHEELHPLLDLPFLPRSMTIRQAGKKSNHGLNYGMKYRRFALENEIPESEAADMVSLYTTTAYPGIPEGFWKPTVAQLRKNRTLENCFGRRVRLLGEWGEVLFDKAYSFVPQSTVGDTVNRAIRAAYECDYPQFMMADLLTQTHDSATYQFPVMHTHKREYTWIEMAQFAIEFAFGEQFLNPHMEYNGRQFQIGTDLKVGLDWGHMQKIKLTHDTLSVASQLEAAWAALTTTPASDSVNLELQSVPLAEEEERVVEWETVPVVTEPAAPALAPAL